MVRKCAYCNDEIHVGEQYYELIPLIGVFLHTDCSVGGIETVGGIKTMRVKVNLMTRHA